MAIVSCFHQTQWTPTYDTNYLLKRPRTHLVTYHKQSANHGHPLLKSGVAQFSALKHFLSALRHSTPPVGRKTDASASPTSLDKRRSELSFPESMVPQTTQIHNLEDIDCPPLKTFALPSDVVEALALASWFQAHPWMTLGKCLVLEGTCSYYYVLIFSLFSVLVHGVIVFLSVCFFFPFLK